MKVFYLILAMLIFATSIGFSLEIREEDGETVYVLTEEEFDKTIIKAEQAKALETSLQETLIKLERERRWKHLTLSLTLPLAGAFIGQEINDQHGVYLGLGTGAAISWLISTLSN